MHSEGNKIRLSVVIPVYRGETTLRPLAEEILGVRTDGFTISEIILVHDCGPDDSARVIEALAAAHPEVRPVWLTRNYGQHAATLAGMASATGDFIVTMDEDGQQDPKDIASLLSAALEKKLQLVYGKPVNPPPHGLVRNVLSRSAKTIASRIIGNPHVASINSFRLIDGEIARSLAAYSGSGVFLDVALFWITGRIGKAPVTLRQEMGRPSGYSFLKLVKHFWQLILTSGTRPLRFITLLGFSSLILAVLLTVYALVVKFVLFVPVQGWASIVIVVSFFSGCILMALGVIAEYLAATTSIVMGKPLYVVGTKPGR